MDYGLCMRTKKEIRDKLLGHPLFVKATQSVKTDDERKALEDVMGSTFIDLISKMDEYVQMVMDDPELLTKVSGGDVSRVRIVSLEPEISGSTG